MATAKRSTTRSRASRKSNAKPPVKIAVLQVDAAATAMHSDQILWAEGARKTPAIMRHGAVALPLPCAPQIGFRTQAGALLAWLVSLRLFWLLVGEVLGLGIGIRIGVGLG